MSGQVMKLSTLLLVNKNHNNNSVKGSVLHILLINQNYLLVAIHLEIYKGLMKK